MSLKAEIVDGRGTGNKTEVDKDGYVHTISKSIPPINGDNDTRIYKGDFVNAAGSSDMKVDGSTVNQDFFISSATDADRYIKTISILIVDAGATLSEFGNATALTNGCELFYEDSKLGNVTIDNSLKSNWDFMRLAQGNPPIGGGTSAYQAGNVISTSEGYYAVLDLQKVFGLPWGIRIPKSSTLKIVLRIKDAIPAVDSFGAVAYGFDRIV